MGVVHYTSADNALKIIQGKKLWLRNTRVMDDWSEVNHGLNLLNKYFSSNRDKFVNAMNACHAGCGEDVIRLFDSLLQYNRQDTYIACFSRHLDSEDQYGRLSMWRAFSKQTAGVALVLNPPPKYSATPLSVFLQPVHYCEDRHIELELNKVLQNIQEQREFLRALPREVVVRLGYLTLMISTVATKHLGFEEEKEWRLIHSPTQYGSPYVTMETKAIRGIPQTIYEFEFLNRPQGNISGIELPELIDRVIIGPTPYADSIAKALVHELTGAGVQQAESKLFFSNIPLR